MRLALGTSVGPYVIEGRIGAGAIGEVYRACDPRLQRAVAVKVLAAECPDSARVSRFEQEARAAAALTHPNIVTIYDVGTHDGRPFLVLELLEGKTLREQLAAGPLPVERVVELALQLARGVVAAHAVKIVHRDLKPDNLFLTRDGTLKILDFGLAKLRPDVFSTPDSPTIGGASEPGLVLGTLGYMAPEQLRGEPVDERADLFAAGAVLHEMVTGQGPFRRDSAAETAAAILDAKPPPLPGTVPPGLQKLILQCLEKDPLERFQAATDLMFALGSALSQPGDLPDAAGEATKQPASSIAVLPFTDMSPTRDQDYLCEGLAEELISSLTNIKGLRIAARSSSFQFRDAGVDVRAVGQRLGVATVLEGSVRKLGDRLRINVQLIDVADGLQRWSRRFDRKLEDVFAIQDEIAECVATSLRGVLSNREREALHHPETAVETYEYFLRGRQMLHRFNRPSIEGARQMFERAIELDPDYAPAWAGLAEVHAWLYEWWGGDEDDVEAADRASRRALELAPDLAEAHAARGFALAAPTVSFRCDEAAANSRYREAKQEFEEALRINPSLFDALYAYARAAFANGEIERSAGLFRRAGEARQEDFQSPILLGQSLRILGRDTEAREATIEGARRVERALELNPTDARALSLGANALADLGQPQRALRWSERAVALYPDEQTVLINGACLRSKLGKKEEALSILENVFARGWGKRGWIENDPDYDPLRGDPRFQALLDKLH